MVFFLARGIKSDNTIKHTIKKACLMVLRGA
jgi:hypothetical protein